MTPIDRAPTDRTSTDGSGHTAVAGAFADEGPPANLGKTVVIGCGNILRGDDAVGPTLIRHLWSEGGIPDGVTLVDGGTAGMDVAFKMRGAAHVVLVDAACTGAEPGTTYRIPGSEIEQLPELPTLSSHSFRWDHSLAFAHWLLGGEYPEQVTVFLIEIAGTEPGADLTPPVADAMLEVGRLVRELWSPLLDPAVPADRGTGASVTVEITPEGDLRIDVDVARQFFPGDALVAVPRGSELWLIPLTGPEGGGLLLKQRNARGDRSTLIWEALPTDASRGLRQAVWDPTNGALRVDLSSGAPGPAPSSITDSRIPTS